jgi:DNA-directed RNA polymerase specialized sigma24 family protein
MNYREIERQTGLPAGTVRSRIDRARKIIKRLRAEDEARNETWQGPTWPEMRT